MSKIYQIPTNFKDAGYLFNGMVSKRNAIDAAILALSGFALSKILPFNSDYQITASILLSGGLGILGIVGIQGIPLSVFIADFIKWNKRKQPYLYNNHGRSFEISAADAMLSEPQLRDSIADILDKAKDLVKRDEPNYIEGQTFEFAIDPELEALQAAEERIKAKKVMSQTEQSSTNEDSLPNSTLPNDTEDSSQSQSAEYMELDIQNLVENIVLDPPPEGDI